MTSIYKLVFFFSLALPLLASCIITQRRNTSVKKPGPSVAPLVAQASTSLAYPQEIRFFFKKPDGYQYEYKFCRPAESCSVFATRAPSQTQLLRVGSIYSARLCEISNELCKPWQLIVLHPLKKLTLEKEIPQTTQSLALAENLDRGLSLANFNKGSYVIASYLVLERRRAESPQLSLAHSGIENLGNTCFLNSSLQFMANSDEYLAKIKQKITADISTGRELNPFFANLHYMLKSIQNSSFIRDTQVFELMASYDILLRKLREERYIAGESLGNLEEDDYWRPSALQRDAEDVLRTISNMIEYETVKLWKIDDSNPSRSTSRIDGQEPFLPMRFINSQDRSKTGEWQDRPEKRSFQSAIDDLLLHYRDTTEPDSRPTELKETMRVSATNSGLSELHIRLVDRTLANADAQDPLLNRYPIGLGPSSEVDVPFIKAGSESAGNNAAAFTATHTQKMRLKSAIIWAGNHYFTYFRQGNVWFLADDSVVQEIIPENQTEWNKMLKLLSTQSRALTLEKVPGSIPAPLTKRVKTFRNIGSGLVKDSILLSNATVDVLAEPEKNSSEEARAKTMQKPVFTKDTSSRLQDLKHTRRSPSYFSRIGIPILFGAAAAAITTGAGYVVTKELKNRPYRESIESR